MISLALLQVNFEFPEKFTEGLSFHAYQVAKVFKFYINISFFFLHYPDDKCYGIVPEERKDCGYNGIQREQCENELRCCFDHTVPGVPWCFKGNEELTEEPTEEGTKMHC